MPLLRKLLAAALLYMACWAPTLAEDSKPARNPELQAQCEKVVVTAVEIGLFTSVTQITELGVEAVADDAMFASLPYDEKLGFARVIACAYGLRQDDEIVEVRIVSAYTNKRLANWFLGLFTVD